MELVSRTLATVILAAALTAFALANEEFERVYWDRGDARKIIKRAHVTDRGSFGEILGATATGSGRPITHGIWLTDDVCWSIAIFVQHEERRTDEEKEEIYKDCRSEADRYYTIYVSAAVTTDGLDTFPSIIDIDRGGQIFLQRRRDKSEFVRPERIDTVPAYMMHLRIVSNATKMAGFDIDRDVLIRFPRDETLLEGQKDIDLELRQGGNRQRLKFSLKKLRANKGRLGNL